MQNLSARTHVQKFSRPKYVRSCAKQVKLLSALVIMNQIFAKSCPDPSWVMFLRFYNILGISWGYLRHTLGISWIYLEHILWICGHISGISWSCPGDMWGIFWAYLGHVLGICGAYFGHIVGISWAYFGHILGVSWAYPTATLSIIIYSTLYNMKIWKMKGKESS